MIGSATILSIAVTVIQNKIMAVALGPSGFGMLAQLNLLIQFLAILGSLGINAGVVKYAAEYNADNNQAGLAHLFATSVWLIIVGGTLTMFGTAILARPIAVWTFDDASLQYLILASLVSTPAAVLAVILRAFLQGLKRLAELAYCIVFGSIFTLAITSVLIFLQGLRGGVTALILSSVVQCVLLGLAFWRSAPIDWQHYLRLPDAALVKTLVWFGLAGLIITAAQRWSALTIRAWVIGSIGLEENGMYQAAAGISNQYLAVMLTSISAYSYARLSELHGSREITLELNHTLRLALLLMTPVMALLLSFRELAVTLAYSSAFIGTASLLPFQLIGDFFQLLAWIFGLCLLPLGKVGAWFWSNTLQIATMVILARLLLPAWGLYGVIVSYVIAWALCTFAIWLYIRRLVHFTLAAKNGGLALTSLAIISVVGLLPSSPAAATTLLALLVCVRFLLTDSERYALRQLIHNKAVALRTR